MLIGASTGFAGAALSGNPYLGVAAGALAGLAANLLFGYVVITRHANQLAAGLSLTFFGLGASALIGRPFVGAIVAGLAAPRRRSISWSGSPRRWRRSCGVFCTAPAGAWRCAPSARRPLRFSPRAAGRTSCSTRRWRSRARSAGSAARIFPWRVALTWDEGMTAGRGFIAIALVIFAGWNPLWAVVGALVFGGAESLQLQFQARGVDVSPFLMNMVPYVLTLAGSDFLGFETPIRRARGARTQFLRRGIGQPMNDEDAVMTRLRLLLFALLCCCWRRGRRPRRRI